MRRSSSRLRRGLLAVFVALVLGCGVWPGRALAEPAAPELVSQGLELRRERRDAEALALFQRAFSSSAQPMILAQIALAEQALGQWVTAERDLTSALATRDAWIDVNRGALEKARIVIQAHLSWLVVTTDVDSAELWLDAQSLGAVRALPWRVAAGPHELLLRSRDGRSIARSIELAAGEREHFHLELPALPTPPAPAPSLPPQNRVPPPARKSPNLPANAAKSQLRESLAWAAAAASVVALAGAVTASVLRVDYARRYNGDGCAPDRSQRCAPYREMADTLGNVAIVGYVVGGSAALGSVALFTAPYWLPSSGPTGTQAGVSLSGRF